LRMNGDCRVAIHKLPGLGSLHERLMGEEFVRRLGSLVLPVTQRAIKLESLRYDVHEAIAVARMHVEQRVASRPAMSELFRTTD
jgi:hypothetical protein